MTFYNIIFGILFLGAVREIFASFALPEQIRSLAFWKAAALTIIVFSDVVYTSHILEDLKKKYNVWMKLLDLVNFIILTLALLSLNPTASNMFQLSVEPMFIKYNIGNPAPDWFFWTLLSIYWLLIIMWIRQGEVHPDDAEFETLKRELPDSSWIRLPAIEKIIWFLIKWGRLIGLLCFAITVLNAFLTPEHLYWLSPTICFLAIFYLLISGVILNLYKSDA